MITAELVQAINQTVLAESAGLQGVALKAGCGLDDVMVAVAAGEMDWQQLAQHLSTLAE